METELLCPLKLVNDIVGGKWKKSIICILENGKPVRYNEIRRKMPDITNMMLSQSLKDLEEYGIVKRTQYAEMPVRVEYTLTEDGKSLLPVMNMISQWGKAYMNRHSDKYSSFCEKCNL